MSNITNTNFHDLLLSYASEPLNIINMCQSSVSLLCTLAICAKVFNFGSVFKSIRDKQTKLKQKREKQQLEKMKKLIEAVQQHKDLNIDELILESEVDDDDDEKTDAGIMRTTKKKHRKNKDNTIV